MYKLFEVEEDVPYWLWPLTAEFCVLDDPESAQNSICAWFGAFLTPKKVNEYLEAEKLVNVELANGIELLCFLNDGGAALQAIKIAVDVTEEQIREALVPLFEDPDLLEGFIELVFAEEANCMQLDADAFFRPGGIGDRIEQFLCEKLSIPYDPDPAADLSAWRENLAARRRQLELLKNKLTIVQYQDRLFRLNVCEEVVNRYSGVAA